RHYDETEREIVGAVAELARYGVGGRNLRVFRTSADREASLLQQILAPALRSRNAQRRKEALDALENLAAVTNHLRHLLLVRDLRKIAG
ncbi:MAG TPA: MerR family transcriptional regulator, partial [Solirubrobacteraceae bacterium]|nr:MerR family transcriptional regulator [Solirubrobacteraceae bacterium]